MTTRQILALIVSTVVAVLALFGATVALMQIADQASQRERERVLSDIAACERANEFRETVLAIAEAGETMDRAIVDVIIEAATGPDDAEFVARLRADLEKRAFGPYERAVAGIEFTDCHREIPGA